MCIEEVESEGKLHLRSVLNHYYIKAFEFESLLYKGIRKEQFERKYDHVPIP